MESLVETGLHHLAEDVRGDVETLEKLVVDEIERSLPEIIAGLRIPTPLDRSARQRIEFKLMGRRGFRPLRGGERLSAIEQLKHQDFSTVLRDIQQIVSSGAHATASGRFVRQKEADFELTNQVPSRFSAAEAAVAGTFSTTAFMSIEAETSSDVNKTIRADSNALQRQSVLGVSAEGTLAKTVLAAKTHEAYTLEVPNTPIELQEPLAERDIRGLIALLRAGKLVAFLEPSASDLIPRGIERIRVPNKRVYRSLRSEDLLSEYHRLAVSEKVDQSPERSNELRLLDALLVSLENEAQWSRINGRRFHLINKKHAVGLTSEELDELDTLQCLAQKQMYTDLKLPFGELAMLESYARNLGFQENS